MDFKEQMKIADKALDMLYPISPSAIVAGGAPLDWYFEKEARDVDIFISVNPSWKPAELRKALTKVGFSSVEIVGPENTDGLSYMLNPNISTVHNCKLDDLDIQIINLNISTYDIVDKFAFNVNKAWYKKSVVLEPSCKYGIENKVLIKQGETYADSDAYRTKIRKKFEDFKYFDSNDTFVNSLFLR